MSTDSSLSTPSGPSSDSQKSRPNRRASLGRAIGSFAGAVLLILTLRWAVAEPYVIPSGSMFPTLLIHDHILVNKLAFGVRVPFTKRWLVKFAQPRRGDVVVFRSVEDDGFFMIKRVVGLPGDTVALDAEARLLINGQALDRTPLEYEVPGENSGEVANQDPYYRVTPADIGGEFKIFDFFEETLEGRKHRGMQNRGSYRWPEEPFQVPPGEVFLMGDNRDNSRDSRTWGSLPVDNLLGRASFVWLSCTQTLKTAPFLCDPVHLRWRRFFHWIH